MHYKEFTYFSFSAVNNYRCGWKDIFFSVVINASSHGNGKAFPTSGWYCTAESGPMHCLPWGPRACGTAGICQAATEAPSMGVGFTQDILTSSCWAAFGLGETRWCGPTWQPSLCPSVERKTHKRFPRPLKTATGVMTIPSCSVVVV